MNGTPNRTPNGTAIGTAVGTPIGWPLRAWFAVELFFAVAAIISVAMDPANTSTNFAWTIKPDVMAALIGAFFMALAPVIVLLMCARRWEMVRVFVLPGCLFTAAQLLVTWLHWDRFAVGTGPFNIWLASYLLPPPVFLACYLWQQGRAGVATTDVRGRRSAFGAALAGDVPLARWQRIGLVTLGALFTLEAVIGLCWPAWFSQSAPWKITPLNARALAGYFLLLGLLLLSMAHENDRDRVRIVTPFLVLLLPAVAFQVSRFSSQVNWSHPRVAISVLLLVAVAAIGISLARCDWRRTVR